MVLPALVVSLLGSAAATSSPPTRDAFLQSTRQAPARPLPAGLKRLFQAGQVSGWEDRLGVPTFFRAPRPAAGEASPRDQGLGPTEAARQHLLRWAPLYGLDGQAAAGAALTRVHDVGQGAVVATFERRVGEVPVFRDRLHVVMNQRLELVALSGYLSPVSRQAGQFRLAEPAAFAAALGEVSGGAPDPAGLRVAGLDAAGMARLEAVPGSGLGVGTLARARKVLFGLPEALVPAFYVELATPGDGAVAEVISAVDGQVLWKKDLVASEAYTYRVWAQSTPPYLPDDSPFGTTLTPLASGTPIALLPAGVASQLVTLSNLPFSRNDPWLPAGAQTTTGNNVDAFADISAPDGFNSGDQRPAVTSPGTFDFPYALSSAANLNGTQISAGVTQLFYTINFLHDWYYDSGFAEVDGNAQKSNFGRGGAEGDAMTAEAQDFGGTDNANMATPSDGASPRMRMYLWSSALSQVTALGHDLRARVGAAGFGPATFDLTAQAITTTPADGCGSISTSLTGQIALIDRGTCTFEEKASNAATAGAVGVVIVDNVEPTTLGAMAGTGDLPILFLTRADGTPLKAAAPTSVRMVRAKGIIRDGDLDATVVSHEWTHYLSNRLISDGAGINILQASGMGEGWSDTGAMLLVVRAEDAQVPSNAGWAGVYAMAAFAFGGPRADTSPYFGLRRFPYSTDLLKNPLTFKHIEDGVALPTTAPAGPGTDLTGSANSEVHNTGEVWAEMLWECYAALLRGGRQPFDEIRERMKRYLVASLKATPGDPSFVEARDALLAVAAATDPRDEADFLAAFAKRGLGIFAVAPPKNSGTNGPLTEDFTAGSELVLVDASLDDTASSCDHDGILDVGETGRLHLSLRNIGTAALASSTVTVTGPAGVVITPSTIALGGSQPLTLVSGSATVTLPQGFSADHLDLQLAWTDPQLSPASPGHTRTATLSVRANLDAAPARSAVEGAETVIDAWTHLRDTALGPYDWNTREVGPLRRAWFGLDAPYPSDLSLVSPPLRVGTGPLVMTLVHRWSFEVSDVYYDGAAIELSSNGGQSWDDLFFPDAGLTSGSYDLEDGGTVFPVPDGGFRVIDGGYNGVLTAPSTNHLGGRPAFVGDSPGYPAFITSVIDLGTAHAGQDLLVRFRVASDNFVNFVGWDLDQIGFSGILNTPFPDFVPNVAKACTAAPVVASAGGDLTVDERTVVLLDGSGSTGPVGATLVGQWAQTSGPAVQLESVDGGTLQLTFRAPEVTADTALGFELTVLSGPLTSAPASKRVLVRDVNRPPSVSASGPAGADGGTEVTLTALAADPDGDPVTLAWSQTAGPTVSLSSTTAALVTFTAPAVSKATDLTFAVAASDGKATSTAQVTVNVGAPPGCGCQSAGGAEALTSLATLLTLAWRARRRRAPAGGGR